VSRLAGVIGDPIGHSRSPRLHGHWLRRYEIDGHYVPLHVRPGDLTEALRLLPRLGFAGVNVTMPHKVAAFELAHEVTDRARVAGAANTLTFRDGRVAADNTDGLGFVRSLQQAAGRSATDLPVVVLGAGGAARGIVAALVEAGAPSVRIANRTAARAEALAALFDRRVTAAPWDVLSEGEGPILLVNTTSLGMTGQAPLRFDVDALAPGSVVADIVYDPLDTPLLAAARARSLVAVDGLGMLLHQAVPGFAAWFGVTPEVDAELRRAVLA
jgi:shikimate dehydrogenase